MYILKYYNYDENNKYALENNLYYSQDYFYKNGLLYKMFCYCDGIPQYSFQTESIICGNYAALLQALANRLNIESYILISNSHAWNLVFIDGDYYYVDPTWLDNKMAVIEDEELIQMIDNYQFIINHDCSDLEWYKKSVNEDVDKSHYAWNIPEHINITPNLIKNKKEYNDKIKYLIMILEILITIELLDFCRKKLKEKNIKKLIK